MRVSKTTQVGKFTQVSWVPNQGLAAYSTVTLGARPDSRVHGRKLLQSLSHTFTSCVLCGCLVRAPWPVLLPDPKKWSPDWEGKEAGRHLELDTSGARLCGVHAENEWEVTCFVKVEVTVVSFCFASHLTRVYPTLLIHPTLKHHVPVGTGSRNEKQTLCFLHPTTLQSVSDMTLLLEEPPEGMRLS